MAQRAMRSGSRRRGARNRFATGTILGVAAVAAFYAMQRRRGHSRRRVHEAVTINRPLAEVYRALRQVGFCPTFLPRDAEIVGTSEHEWIVWRSVEGGRVEETGTIRFEHAPGARGTEVHVELEHTPRAGAIGSAVARLVGHDFELRVRDELRRFKQVLETGEIPISDGPAMWRPAQPPSERPDEFKARMGVPR